MASLLRNPPRWYWIAVLVVAVVSLALAILLDTGRWWWVIISVVAHAEMIYIACTYLGNSGDTFGFMTNDNETQPESTPDETPETPEATPSGTQEVEADSVTINNEAAPAEPDSE